MATDYHVVTLPGKTKLPVRDYFLRDGRNFSVDGDITSDMVVFDGKTDVKLNSTIGNGKVTLEKVNDSAKAADKDSIVSGDPRLVTAGAVADYVDAGIGHISRVPEDKIDSLFGY